MNRGEIGTYPEYRSPRTIYTTEHYFNPQKTTPVAGHLATAGETDTDAAWLDSLNAEIKPVLTDDERGLLFQLGSGILPGLPLTGNSDREYLAAMSVFSVQDETDEPRPDTWAYPWQQRGTTSFLGLISRNGQVCPYLSRSGTGISRSHSQEHSYMQQGSINGLLTRVRPQIIGTTMARQAGVMTPLILPPVAFDEMMYRGKRYPAGEFLKHENMFCCGSAYSENLRVAGLFRGIQSFSFSFCMDIDFILMNLDTEITVSRRRLIPFLSNVRTVDEFNDEHHTRLFLGCSRLMHHEYGYPSYTSAFRHQITDTVRTCIVKNIHHLNFSFQNTAVSAEVGDWDKFGYEVNGLYVVEDDERMSQPRMTAGQGEFSTILSGYQVQAFVSALIAGEFIPVDEYIKSFRRGLPLFHPYRKYSMADFQRLNYPDLHPAIFEKKYEEEVLYPEQRLKILAHAVAAELGRNDPETTR